MGTPLVSFDGKDCSGCKHLNERGYCEFTACIIPCTVRATIPDVKPQTNADRIRAMTDEELAEFIASGFPEDVCKDRCGGDESFQCSECVLDWLKEEGKT